MSAGHERAARKLAEMAGEDREWVLAQLAEPDRKRIRELMSREPRREPVALAEGSAEGAVEHAGAGEVARALADEPDWFIALILARRRWPWDRELLKGLDPARVEALREITQSVREAARPRPGEEALAALAAKLRRIAPAPEPRSAFDDVLAGMIVWDKPGAAERGGPWRQ